MSTTTSAAASNRPAVIRDVDQRVVDAAHRELEPETAAEPTTVRVGMVQAVSAEPVPTPVLLLAERATDVQWAMIASAEPETAVLVSHAFVDMAVATLVERLTAVTPVLAVQHLAVLELATPVLLLAERATDVPLAMIAWAGPETAVLADAFADMAVATLVEPPTAVTLVPAALHLAVLEPATAALLLAEPATAALETDAAPRPTRALAKSLS